MTRLTPKELQAFLVGQQLYCFDPADRAHVATIRYRKDGTCLATFADGGEDQGTYGLTDDAYWTQYTNFRAGERNAFHLVPVAPQVVQAWHTDGRRAFLQSPLPHLPVLEEGTPS